MSLDSGLSELNRRQFLGAAGGATMASINFVGASPQVPIAKEGTVRDRLWVFACPVNNDYPHLRRRSLMTPAESAFFFGIPNILIIQVRPRPGEEKWFKPFEPPFDQYAIALRPLNRVVWSVVGGGGITEEWERKQVLEMAKRIPNFVGVFMDDFFHPDDKQVASLAVDDLRNLQDRPKGARQEVGPFCDPVYPSIGSSAGGVPEPDRRHHALDLEVRGFSESRGEFQKTGAGRSPIEENARLLRRRLRQQNLNSQYLPCSISVSWACAG